MRRQRCWVQGARIPLAKPAGQRDTVSMSAIPQTQKIPVEVYLGTSYRPDCDYVDGQVLERNVGEKEHSIVQQALLFLFRTNRDSWKIEVFPELRIQIAPHRYRVPDVTVVGAGVQWSRILRTPPLIVAEILSPEDSLRDMRERVDDFLAMGTEHIWIVDPGLRKAYVCSKTGFQEPENGILEIPGTPIRIVLSELFAELDRA